jgi:hypothetical protein
MEAATPLPFPPQVRTVGDRLRVDGLVIADECVVRLARDREDAGEDAARLVEDAIVIGARVLEREQTGADLELVRKELEKTTTAVTASLSTSAERVSQELAGKVVELFGPEQGQVTRVIERHFGDDSASAVQHRVRAAVEEVMARSREELRRQFTSADASNPLALFQKSAVEAIQGAAAQQHAHLREMTEKIATLELRLTELRAEREKLDAVEAEAERGTAKGRSYEEAVADTLDALATARGDACEAVGDAPGAAGKKGDVLVSIEASSGPCRGRIVFEAKDKKSLSRNDALAYLDASLHGRDADYAVLVVPSDRLPARTWPLREFNGDKLFVTYDPDHESPLALEVAYGLARARVLMRRGEAGGVDTDALRAEIERAQQAMEDVRRIKSQLTGATNGIAEARSILETMAEGVRAHLTRIEALVAAADG